MPCIILTGHPCSGKTTLAHRISDRVLSEGSPFSKAISKVVIINEESACPGWSKNRCYATSHDEKKSRAALKSAFDRAVGVVKDEQDEASSENANRSTLIILDSMNYIKGFRYELHCISKSASMQHCVLWVLNRHETIKRFNAKRRSELDQSETKEETGGPYDESLMDELILRYELPDERNRWDKPLYTIDLSSESNDQKTNEDRKHQSDVLKRTVYNMHALNDKIGDIASSEGSDATAKAQEPKTATHRPKKSAFTRKKKAPSKNSQDTASDAPIPTAANAVSEDPKEDGPPKDEPKSTEIQLDAILDSFLFHTKALTQGASTKLHNLGD